MKVQCPSCKKVYHETTEKFNPDVRPNGAMVRLLDPWKGWQWAAFDAEGAAVSTTLCSEMLCPGCTAPLAPSGRLTVIPDETAPPPFDQMPPDSKKQEEPVPLPLQEDAKSYNQAKAEVTHTEEPPPAPKRKKKTKKKKAKKKIK